ncbi:sugar-binding domain-containing protein [Pedobacter deserti]|uniref:sugar-binding domain-containing protein n=1 Tax=Pedobacter deserti TaxID=2817382 RepID=UPI00210EE14F|nr:sugar-binding domain-containing protein [Pedobacter sp. SYSU D00382]
MSQLKCVLVFLLTLLLYNHAFSENIRTSKSTKHQDKSDLLNLHDEYPRPQMTRKAWRSLNGQWNFEITRRSERATFSSTSRKIKVPYPLESALSGANSTLNSDQLLWYKKRFTVVAKPKERVLLHFGAVDWEAHVFINDKLVGSHTGGYTSFTFDITDAIRSGENELVVKVYDPTDKGIGPHGKQTLNPGNIYYTPSSGIWQTVWLETVPENYVEQIIMTPDIDNSLLHLVIDASSSTAAKAQIQISTPGCQTCKVVSQKVADDKVNITLRVANARLWSPDDPFLYNLEISLGTDRIESYFGMRKISVAKDSEGFDRIMLNNKYTYNLGTLDQGFWPDGLYTAPSDEALAWDIKVIKAMGFNTIRKHIKVEPARWYYYADRMGIMVWQDLVNPNQGLPKGAKEQFEKESAEIVSQLISFPCITTWVLFNEKWGQYDQERLTNWLKVTDPSRLVNGHSGEDLYVNGELRSPSPNAYIRADVTDVHSYPNPMLSQRHIGKAQVCGEFGGVAVPVPGHQWDDLTGWGYIQVTADELDQKYDSLVKQLVNLEKLGLSASIYTQPFDVEGEENGLITYDRKVIKIPIKRLREIHAQMIKLDNGPSFGKLSLSDIDKSDNDSRYAAFQLEFKNGKRDSAFLRRLTLMAQRKGDTLEVNKYGKEYFDRLKLHFTKRDLQFLDHITAGSNDFGFQIYQNQVNEINAVLGPNAAESKMRVIIGKEELSPYINAGTQKPDWVGIEDRVRTKYGSIGLEKYYGERMIWALEAKDWKTFIESYVRYFSTAYVRSEYHVNNMTWPIFEHSADPEVLSIAIKTMAYSIKHFDQRNYQAFDTYANLLYKAGRTQEAIEWQQKAVEGLPNEEALKETLEKMKKGFPTWDVKNQIN